MIPSFTREQILHEILIAPRAGLVALADTEIIERPGWWQIVTPSLRQGGLNEVACSELPDDEADGMIDAAIAVYRRRGLRFRWLVAPGTRPVDLADRLARRGLQRSESLAMARATGGILREGGPAISIDEVTLATVDEFTRVMAAGWGMEVAPLDALHRRTLAAPGGHHHLFVARYEGLAAAAAAYVALERSACLIGAVVLPGRRGLGLYRALVDARLRHAAARGLGLATSVARSETSAPILARLGFATLCPLAMFMG